jgi:hypothetical protein
MKEFFLHRNAHIMQTLAVDKLQLVRMLDKLSLTPKPADDYFITWLRHQRYKLFFHVADCITLA